MVADGVWKWKNRDRLDYMDIGMCTDGSYTSGSVGEKEKERIKAD